jgi:hypothetical protein
VWAARANLDPGTVRSRLDRLGWSVERALSTPPDRRYRKGGRPRAGEPRPVPRLRRHAVSNRAFVRWRSAGRDLCQYLGEWESVEARDAYRRFAAEWVSNAVAVAAPVDSGLGVGELIARRLRWAQAEYVKAVVQPFGMRPPVSRADPASEPVPEVDQPVGPQHLADPFEDRSDRGAGRTVVRLPAGDGPPDQ